MTFCTEEPNRPLTGRWKGHEWTRLSPHEEQLAAKQAEIDALTAQLSVACRFHGEDLVPALIAENERLTAQVARANQLLKEKQNDHTFGINGYFADIAARAAEPKET